MFDEFNKHLKYMPESFCFPYNYDTPLYKEILHKKGFNTFFGKGRINILDL